MRTLLFALCLLPTAALAGPGAWESLRADCQSRAETVDDLRGCKQIVFFACKEELGDAPGSDGTCQAAEALAWDGELNQLWPQLKAMSEERGLSDQLLATQKAWIAFRDASCRYQADWANMIAADAVWEEQNCLSEMTAERVFDFRLMLVDG